MNTLTREQRERFQAMLISVAISGRVMLSEREFTALLAEADAAESLRKELRLARGAMDAQDDRERAAGEKCGVSWAEAGCDWPDAVADKVLALRERWAAAIGYPSEKGHCEEHNRPHVRLKYAAAWDCPECLGQDRDSETVERERMESRLATVEAECGAMREAFQLIVDIRNGWHPDKSMGKCTAMWRVAKDVLSAGTAGVALLAENERMRAALENVSANLKDALPYIPDHWARVTINQSIDRIAAALAKEPPPPSKETT